MAEMDPGLRWESEGGAPPIESSDCIRALALYAKIGSTLGVPVHAQNGHTLVENPGSGAERSVSPAVEMA
jgi:hypothetical protein